MRPLSRLEEDKQYDVEIIAPIDLDRGVELRFHEKSGMEVWMYVDEPGVYLDSSGKEVPEQLAALVGYPIEKHRKERLIRQKMADTERAMRQQLAQETQGEKKIVQSRGGYVIVAVGDLGYHQVEDADGTVLSKKLMPLAEAKFLLDVLAGAEAEVKEPKGAKDAK